MKKNLAIFFLSFVPMVSWSKEQSVIAQITEHGSMVPRCSLRTWPLLLHGYYDQGVSGMILKDGTPWA
jgi:hypothetical protein